MKKRFIVATVSGLFLVGTLAGAGILARQQGWQAPAWLNQLKLVSTGPQKEDVGLFCHEHGVPEKFCTLCHAELNDKLLMCTEHGLPEEICTLCHPDNEIRYGLKMICPEHGVPEPFCIQCNPALAAGEVESDWCTTHAVPESLCTLCNPDLTETVAMCPDHNIPQALCTICQPDLAANFRVCPVHRLPVGFCPDHSDCTSADGSVCATGTCPINVAASPNGKPQKPGLPRVQFATPGIADTIGLKTAPITARISSTSLKANAEVGYDENRLVHVLPRVSGILHEVRVELGDVVRKGDTLAIVDSAELGQAKADYLASQSTLDLAQKNLDRLQSIKDGVVAGKSLLEAQAELSRRNAELLRVRQTLLNFGLKSYEISALADESEEDRNLLRIVAPQDGTIVQRRAVSGEAVQATSSLFTVADLTAVWVHMDVYEKDLQRISTGKPMVLRIPGLAPLEFAGTVTWIDSRVDDKTRTIHVRANVSNERGLLRANMFGEAEIELDQPHTSLTVPSEALQWEGSSYVVFVRREQDLYEPHRVLRGDDDGTQTRLVWTELTPGTPVVTTGSFLLKTELMKGSIGAGCCGE